MPDFSWEEVLDRYYNPFLYTHFCTGSGSGSGGVVYKLGRRCGLVPVAVDVFFCLGGLSVVCSLEDEK